VLLVVSFSSPRDADNLSLRVENVCISRRGTLFYCTSFWNLHDANERLSRTMSCFSTTLKNADERAAH
ncbi:MAG: hypothetical protein ACFNJR_07135, partial [Segatella oulorum]|uniref:hypothetical protein n=1 Tax=Segatella oulorum TaxID=28136 RepID=UPI003613F303